ncbi:zf-HC2 domain-containing protein [Hyalangium sp.]|uniref:zf-HC2 domain-containing protein n=1 Tax=Hyalangium sp. TaxID=2028555 RepID=UPI002D4E1BFD|nr:zf-HC2 domain-containing protein [Hyalangium sp.]HYH99653.1 zf-HC2 domain-containing protein [Hyalangium sp.]
MSGLCDNLDLFVDEELEPSEAERFRIHVLGCASCEARLREALHLEMMAAAAYAEGEPEAPRAHIQPLWKRSWGRRGAGLVALAVSLVALVYFTTRQPTADLDFSPGATRPLEARLSHPSLARHRPYVPMRSGEASAQALSLEELARREEQGDLAGVATAYLLQGAPGQAAAFLERMSPSAERANDLAVLRLQTGAPAEALVLLRGVWAVQPRDDQAMWNRALALRELGLAQEAEEAFAEVAGRGEPGWSEEAQRQAEALRKLRLGRQALQQQEVEAFLQRLSQPGEDLRQEARRHPEVARMALHEAARSAVSGEQARGLLPLAEELDRLAGGAAVLGDVVQGVAGRDFAIRAPLAREYGRLLRGELTDPAALVERLRKSEERDVLLGALLRTGLGEPSELATLAVDLPEPRFRLKAERLLARHEEAQGQRVQAEERLLRVVQSCRALGLDASCSENAF